MEVKKVKGGNYSSIFFINKDWLRRAVGSTKFNQIRAFWLLEITKKNGYSIKFWLNLVEPLARRQAIFVKNKKSLNSK